ncbi:hypothetical protein cand_037990 [Cryptosporidium andersoni]|uniref:Uncharacterized protein n=1 Tax=Cryptosporidium andersoni TaxID=117008 RepID=A0A1J4MVA7_9CRYT|nr:hypothetical protein cand_037990 [Cryptosporidium andersoni]
MSDTERLEFLYDPKVLRDDDNEIYLLGTQIPRNLTEINDSSDEESVPPSIRNEELIKRLKEDPLVTIKSAELRHRKIIGEFNKKSSNQDKSVTRIHKRSFSRSPPLAYKKKTRIASNKHTKYKDQQYNKIDKEYKLKEMLEYGEILKKQRYDKFNGNFERSIDSDISVTVRGKKYIGEIYRQISDELLGSLGSGIKGIIKYKR